MPPTILLMLALAMTGPATYGVMWVKREYALAAANRERDRAVTAARSEGRAAGLAEGRAAGLKAAAETKEALATAEVETPLLPDKAALIKACKTSTSCRERSTLK